MINPATDPVGAGVAETLAELGYDYIELSLRDLAALPEAARRALAVRLERAGLHCEACNNFFPAGIRLTGPEVSLAHVLDYARGALATAAGFGAEVVVFGSAGARQVPAGFSPAAATAQLQRLLVELAPVARSHGITIAIEHLNRGESNIVNSLAEAARLARAVGHPSVQVLLDLYHLQFEDEDPAIITEIASSIAHVHFATLAGRTFPSPHDGALPTIFGVLSATGYSGRCSVEAFSNDFPSDAARLWRTWENLTRPPSATGRKGP